MKDVSELGRIVKDLFPGRYNDIPDAELGRIYKIQHPGKYDDFVDTAIEVMPDVPLDLPQFDADVSRMLNELESLAGKYNADRGIISSWYRGKQSESRGNFLANLNTEMTLLIQTISQKIEARTLPGRLQLQHDVEILMAHNQRLVLQMANSLGMDYQTYINRVQMQLEIDKEIILAERLAEVDLNKQQRLKELEVQIKEKEAALDRLMLEYESSRTLKQYQTFQTELSQTMKLYYELKEIATTPFEKAELKRLKDMMDTYAEKVQKLKEEL